MDAVELDRPERLRAWLARQRTVHEVRADGQGGWHWQALAADDAAPFDPPSVLPPFSAKGFFFAERERLFRFDGGQFLGLMPEVEPQVLFGLHACDLRAVAYRTSSSPPIPITRPAAGPVCWLRWSAGTAARAVSAAWSAADPGCMTATPI